MCYYNLMKDDKKFLELINSLQKDTKLFFKGWLHGDNEKSFVEYVEKLSIYINFIQDESIKLKVESYVDSIKQSKNYKIYKQEEEKRKIKQNQEQQKLKQKEQILKIIDKLNELLMNGDLKAFNDIYKQYNTQIKIFAPDCYYRFKNLPIYNNTYTSPRCCKAILEKRKIKYLLHFTNIKNLQSILENNLCPVSYLQKHNINYINNDTKRLDNKLDCISLSIEYPNSYMLKSYMIKDRFCLLILNAQKVLLYNNCTKYYLYCNAARNDAAQWLETEVLSRDKYLENMFMEHNPDTRENCQYSRLEKRLKDYLPTNVQAEILFKGIISSAYVESIVFQTQDDLNLCKEMFSNKELFDKYTLIVDKKYFEEREDFPWEDR